MCPTGMGLSCSTSQPILKPFPALGRKGDPPVASWVGGGE